MPRARARTLALVAAPLILAAGCGGAEPAAEVRGGRLAVTQDDYLFDPQRIAVARPGPVTLTVRNRGRIGHTLRLRRGARLYVEVPTLLPGERTTVTRTLPAGRYRMFCAIANHEELGMWGTLEVAR